MSDLASRRSLLLSPVWRDQEREIAKLKGQLKKAKANANCLRKYKFQTIKMKSQIRALINHKEQAPPKIANLFQFLRDNDYDAYLHLEKMLLPFSHENRMSVIHKSIRQPDWMMKEHESPWRFCRPSRDWMRLVRNPQIEYKSVNEVPEHLPINIHGVMLNTQGSGFYDVDNDEKLQLTEQKDELIKKLKVLGIEAKMSWSKRKMYERLMELE